MINGLFFILLLTIVASVASQDMYCGDDDCYDILGLQRDVEKPEIRKSFRKLSIKYHPDRNTAPDAEANYTKMVAAYEVLYDDEMRKDYHWYLDHPEDRWRNNLRYYRNVVVPKFSIGSVVTVFLIMISSFQWVVQNQMHQGALKSLRSSDQVLTAAKEQMKLKLKEASTGIKKKKKLNKREKRETEKLMLEQCIDEVLAVANIRGGYKAAKLTDMIGFRVIIIPYTLFQYCKWRAEWYYRFEYKGEAYGEEEKLYLTKQKLEVSDAGWYSMDAEKREELLQREIYIQENFDIYEEEVEMEIQKRNAKLERKWKRYNDF